MHDVRAVLCRGDASVQQSVSLSPRQHQDQYKDPGGSHYSHFDPLGIPNIGTQHINRVHRPRLCARNYATNLIAFPTTRCSLPPLITLCSHILQWFKGRANKNNQKKPPMYTALVAAHLSTPPAFARLQHFFFNTLIFQQAKRYRPFRLRSSSVLERQNKVHFLKATEGVGIPVSCILSPYHQPHHQQRRQHQPPH